MIFTVAFWRKTFEAVVVTFAATFAGTGIFTSGLPSMHSLWAALISSGVAALYVLAKAVGGSQVITESGAKHAEQNVQNQF